MADVRATGTAVGDTMVWGAGTFVWYAMSDVVASRGLRGLLKTGIVAAAGAWVWVQVRREHDHGHDEAAVRDDDGGAGAGGSADASGSPDTTARIRALTSTVPVLDGERAGLRPEHLLGSLPWAPLALGAVVTAASIAGTVATERAIHRFGDRLGARGVAAPHTRIGVVAGLLTVAAGLVGDELERRTTQSP
jgi:hypothetical protein